MSEVEIRADELAALSRRLKEAGNRGLQREMSTAISRSVRPLRGQWAAAASRLPQRGGLAARVASSKVRVKRRNTGTQVGVRLELTSDYALRDLDEGHLRHLTFGREPWITQEVEPGTFTDPWERNAPRVRAEIVQAMDRVARQIEG